MNGFDAGRAVSVLRVLANAPRLAILQRLLEGECGVAELEAGLGIRQPGLSQHLGELREAGLVAARREARSVFYRLADPRARALVTAVLAGFGADARREAAAAVVSAAGTAAGTGDGTGRGAARPFGVARFARVLS